MNLKRKAIVLALLLSLVLVFAGCSFETSPYQTNNASNYNVSVKFDANGGSFNTMNTPNIVDSYNITEIPAGEDGNVSIPLLAPEDPARKDTFLATKTDSVLVGWFAQRTEVVGDDGSVTYTYADRWDFATDRLQVNPNEEHSAENPVLTLYAAWAPAFQLEFYDLATGELLTTTVLDGQNSMTLQVPHMDEESGSMEMYRFPKRDGYTFNGVYLDAEGTQKVEDDTVTHPGVLNEEDATVTDSVMKLYIDWMEGEWYHIYTAQQFVDNYSIDGSYEIHADLDFAEENWPSSLMYGNYTGTIRGNGHTFSNITVEQTNNSKTNAGLFGQLAPGAKLENITFENVTFTILNGTRVAGTAYGLLAGTVSQEAVVENVSVVNSVLQIDSGCYFGTEDYVIGLVCGMGETDVDASGITCTVTGDAPEKLVLRVDGEEVRVDFAQ